MQWASADVVAKVLGVTKNALACARCQGYGPPSIRMPNGRIRYPIAGLRTWLAERDKLGPRQQAVLEFIRVFHRQKRRGPTFSELKRGLGLHRRGAQHHVLRSLERRGLLRREPGAVGGVRPA